MAKYRNTLPQLGGGLYLTDGGIETTLIFHEGLDLPDFAAFHLLKTHEGEAALRKYFRTYAEIAKQFGTGLILESATWRANADWGTRLGYTPEQLADANRGAIHLLEDVRNEFETERTSVVISGCLGPRGDGYVPDRAMSEQEAAAYHRDQVETLVGSAADMVCAITMNYVEEALGIARVAQRADMPVAISFTVETDGNLPTGQTLKAAIEQVDDATSGYPCYYMINCAHPAHFEHVLAEGGLWLERIRGLRANASSKSHAELNESPELDVGNPVELGSQYARLKTRLPRLNVMGGCCGTDHRHVEQIAEACSPLFCVEV
ncbi:MAG TPA: homocysteine S-methyltransferase family protein [Gemmatimonadaceae bacterium]|nr:homocysteine S-methyltransferase family protein [Gemmatimonadaceae bacterium]